MPRSTGFGEVHHNLPLYTNAETKVLEALQAIKEEIQILKEIIQALLEEEGGSEVSDYESEGNSNP